MRWCLFRLKEQTWCFGKFCCEGADIRTTEEDFPKCSECSFNVLPQTAEAVSLSSKNNMIGSRPPRFSLIKPKTNQHTETWVKVNCSSRQAPPRPKLTWALFSDWLVMTQSSVCFPAAGAQIKPANHLFKVDFIFHMLLFFFGWTTTAGRPINYNWLTDGVTPLVAQ